MTTDDAEALMLELQTATELRMISHQVAIMNKGNAPQACAWLWQQAELRYNNAWRALRTALIVSAVSGVTPTTEGRPG